MKISTTEKLKFFLKDSFGNDTQIELLPNQIVYSSTDILSNSLRIYSKKGIIKLEDIPKPSNLDYNIVYPLEEIKTKISVHKKTTVDKKEEVKVNNLIDKSKKIEQEKTNLDKLIARVDEYKKIKKEKSVIKKKKATKAKNKKVKKNGK